MASIGALTIQPSSLLWTPPPGVLDLPPLRGDALVTLQHITSTVARHLERLWQPGESLDGDMIGRGGVTSLQNVGWELPNTVDAEGFTDERCRQVAELLADRADFHKLAKSGRWPNRPIAGAQWAVAQRRNLSVRGLIHYNIQTDNDFIRFSILGG